MASPDTIDVESLLAPISDDAPTGADVREDPSPTSQYQTIKMERTQARAAERQSLDGNSQEAYAHWTKIAQIAPKILTEESKDLEVASWYTEAMTRIHGFAGLRDSFKLIQGLLNTFWDDLHPMPDEFGIETRVSCLAGLNGEGTEGVLIPPIRKVEITEGYSPGPYGLWQYLQALDVQKLPDEDARRQKIGNMGFSLEDIEKAVEESSETFFVNSRADIEESMSIYREVGTKLDELCGIDEAPPVRAIVEVLEECLGAINHLGRFKFPAEDSTEAEEEGEAAGEETTAEGGTVKVVKQRGPVESREDAFKQLNEIATFFRKTEPHSPISYMLEKAVKWGNMPLGELINELITDSSQRERYSELTGVQCEE